MLQRTLITLRKRPRNMGAAPQLDTWHQKYDAWAGMNRMRKLVGTGFYVPPEWYQHFRMFPPPHNSSVEEETQNPLAHEEHQKSPHENERRMALRDELAKRSRDVASAGNRYMNLFWVTKPLDEMERSYHQCVSEMGLSHGEAVERVMKEHYAKQAVRRRVHALHLEEAKLSGKFVTMREGTAVIQALAFVHKGTLAPQQYAELSSNIRQKVHSKPTRYMKKKRLTQKKLEQQQKDQKEGEKVTTAAAMAEDTTVAAAPKELDAAQKAAEKAAAAKKLEAHQKKTAQEEAEMRLDDANADIEASVDDAANEATRVFVHTRDETLVGLRDRATRGAVDSSWHRHGGGFEADVPIPEKVFPSKAATAKTEGEKKPAATTTTTTTTQSHKPTAKSGG
eukprot:PhM_4_TR12165/c0_g2_i1/m.26219